MKVMKARVQSLPAVGEFPDASNIAGDSGCVKLPAQKGKRRRFNPSLFQICVEGVLNDVLRPSVRVIGPNRTRRNVPNEIGNGSALGWIGRVVLRQGLKQCL